MQNNTINAKELKPALSYSEQVQMLQEKHNLIIDNTVRAAGVLKRINYYRLCAYGLTFLDPNDNDKYGAGNRTIKQYIVLKTVLLVVC